MSKLWGITRGTPTCYAAVIVSLGTYSMDVMHMDAGKFT